MVIERGITIFWPVWTIGLVVIALACLGLFTFIPELHRISLITIGLTLMVFAIRGLLRYKTPTLTEARMRLDQHTGGLLLLLLDTPKHESTLWQHARAEAQGTRIPTPMLTNLSRYDPYALRFAPVLLLVLVAILTPKSEIASRLSAFFSLRAQASHHPIRAEGWITPPPYTQQPPIYFANLLKDHIKVPVESQLTLKLFHTHRPSGLNFLEGTYQPETQTYEGTSTILQDMSLETGAVNLPSLEIQAIPDKKPEISIIKQPFITKANTLGLRYHIKDDYDDVKTKITIETEYWPEAYEVHTTQSPQDFRQDILAHPYAGQSVQLRITAIDARGHTTETLTEPVVLPEKIFSDPMAKALIEQRKKFALDDAPAEKVNAALQAILKHPQTYFINPRPYLLAQKSRMALQSNPRKSIDYLWDAAIYLEEGNLNDAREQLDRAQARLAEAISRDASSDEVAALMQDLRKAIQNYLSSLPQQNGSQSHTSEQQLSQGQMQEMLNQLEDAIQNGMTEQAEQMLTMLDQLLQNLQPSESVQGHTLSQQQDQLSKDTFDILRNENGLPSDTPLTSTDELAERQDDLRKQLPNTTDIQEIENAMREAQDALKNRDLENAIRHQQHALDGLRQYEQSTSQSGQQAQGDEAQAKADPLGRAVGKSSNGEDSFQLDGKTSQNRTRTLTDTIRRRLENAPNDSIEEKYLQKLLENF